MRPWVWLSGIFPFGGKDYHDLYLLADKPVLYNIKGLAYFKVCDDVEFRSLLQISSHNVFTRIAIE